MTLLARSMMLLVALTCAGCVQAQAPTDLGDPVAPATSGANGGTTPPTTPNTGPFSYNEGIKAILDADCLSCHGPRRADGGYSVATYAQTMREVRAGNANSRLIVVTRSGGSMFRYWSGSQAARSTKAEMVRAWIVNNNAQESR